jgi:ribosome maturation factor RimP
MNQTTNAPPLLERLRTIAEEVANREGCKLYDVEFVTGSQGRGRTLRIYIDRDGQGVSVDDCANVSRGLNLLLDVEDPLPGGAYVLEVSSPGLERPLKQLWHFQTAIGKRITVKLNQSLEDFNPEGPAKVKNCKSLTGELTRADENGLEMNWDGVMVRFPVSAVHRAHMVFVISTGSKKPEKKR